MPYGSDYVVYDTFLHRFYQMIFGYPCDISARIRAYHILKNLRAEPNEKILDAGCGIGVFSLEMSKNGVNVVGVDSSIAGIKYAVEATKSHDKINFLTADILRLPFKEETFDKIVCADVLEHIEDDLSTVSEFVRVLKKNGILLIHVPHKNIFSCILSTDKIQTKLREAGHVRNGYSLKTLEHIISSNRMRTVYHKYTFKTFGMLAFELAWKSGNLFNSPWYIFPFLLILSFLDVFSRKRGNCILLIAKKN